MFLFNNSKNSDHESKLKSFELIEKQYDFILPKYYKLIQLTFDLGQFKEIWKSYVDNFLRVTPLYDISYNKNGISFWYGWLFSPMELMIDLKFYSERETFFSEYKVIRIGNIVAGGGLYLGVGKDNGDYIYKFVSDADSAPIMLNDNIYSFLNNLEINTRSQNQDFINNVGKLYMMPKNLTYSIKADVFEEIQANKQKNEFLEIERTLNKIEKIISDVRAKNFN